MNLREMVDGTGNLSLNITSPEPRSKFRTQQEIVIRRSITRTGPTTNQIQVGRILAFGENNTATVSILGPQGSASQKVVNLRDCAPATAEFKRNSIQFNPQYRRGW
jgi:hypothetical protein